MKKLNVALVILMSLGVVACGSGGGNGDNQSAKPNETVKPIQPQKTPEAVKPAQPQKTTEAVKPTQPQNPTMPVKPDEKKQEETPYTANAEIVGGGFIIPRTKQNIKSVSLTGKKSSFNVLNVEGKLLEIVPTQGIISNVVRLNANNTKHFASKGQYTVAGFVWEEGLNNQYAVAMGKEATKEMPTSGQARYVGHSATVFGVNSGSVDQVALNKANLTVDFAEKKLTGSITNDNNSEFVPVKLSADITKNTFFGNVDNVKVQGGFYGPNADEVAGDYIREGKNVQPTIGVFQAAKQ